MQAEQKESGSVLRVQYCLYRDEDWEPPSSGILRLGWQMILKRSVIVFRNRADDVIVLSGTRSGKVTVAFGVRIEGALRQPDAIDKCSKAMEALNRQLTDPRDGILAGLDADTAAIESVMWIRRGHVLQFLHPGAVPADLLARLMKNGSNVCMGNGRLTFRHLNGMSASASFGGLVCHGMMRGNPTWTVDSLPDVLSNFCDFIDRAQRAIDECKSELAAEQQQQL